MDDNLGVESILILFLLSAACTLLGDFPVSPFCIRVPLFHPVSSTFLLTLIFEHSKMHGVLSYHSLPGKFAMIE